MTQTHEQDYRRSVASVGKTEFLPGSRIEIIRALHLDAPPRFALFDFDGTLSLVREGWPDVMIPMMVDALAATGTAEPIAQLTDVARAFVMELTGKQTIYQMIRLAEEVAKRGGKPADPVEYKQRYHDALMERIESRREALRSGSADPETMLVPGSYEILRELQNRDVQIFLASGTDENYVREEVELLGLTPYFGPHVYGAVDDYKSFSKQMVIERILKENDVDGSLLLGFGDGYVEIDNVKTSGGTAIAVASDETNRSGQPDAWKRERLIGVGADVVIPDFAEAQSLCQYLWKEV